MRTDTTARERDARDLLLSAWRSEIVAASVYELIARRLPAPGADILRRMAQAENGHRARLEARMSELAIEIPSSDSVRPSLWLRLQARVAPVDGCSRRGRRPKRGSRRPVRASDRRSVDRCAV
jgi:hypothetical protein